jgi:hypothetical protein
VTAPAILIIEGVGCLTANMYFVVFSLELYDSTLFGFQRVFFDENHHVTLDAILGYKE